MPQGDRLGGVVLGVFHPLLGAQGAQGSVATEKAP